MRIKRIGLSLLVITLIEVTAPQNVLQAQSATQIDYIIDRGFRAASHVERFRELPNNLQIEGITINAPQYFQMSIQAILQLADLRVPGQFDSNWQTPNVMYPPITLSEEVYGRMISKEEYLSLFETVNNTSWADSRLPSTFDFRGDVIRFVDAFYLSSQILRFYRAFGYLPSVVDPKIAAPDGLFPWSAPEDKREFIGAVDNEEGSEYGSHYAFYDNSAMDYQMYALAKEIIVGETDIFRAGKRIYDWVNSHYRRTPYGALMGGNIFGHIENSYEVIRNMQGTSGTPSRPKRGLYPAAGIPHANGYNGYGGVAFTENEGWFNIETHRIYGSDYTENSFLVFDERGPLPNDPSSVPLTKGHIVLPSISEAIEDNTTPVDLRAFWVNPGDVEAYGATQLVDMAMKGDFNTIVLTVKTFLGYLYFDTGITGVDMNFDAISDLLSEAKNVNIKLLVAFNTLTDYQYPRVEHVGQRYMEPINGWDLEYNEFHMSPCSAEYEDYIKELIEGLYGSYDIDGLVMANHSVYRDAWANSSCNITQSDEAQSAFLSEFLNGLANHAKSLDENKEVYLLSGQELTYQGYELLRSFTDSPDLELISNDFDGIILNFPGQVWITNEFDLRSYVNQRITELKNAHEIPLHFALNLSKEWQYTPEFYRGMAKQFKSSGLDGVFIVAENSSEGELGPAFVSQHIGKLEQMKFLSPPPETTPRIDVVTSIEQTEPAEARLSQNFPNPFANSTTIKYELNKAGMVNLSIMTLSGNEIRNLVNEVQGEGEHQVTWDGKDMSGASIAPGLYLYRLKTGAFEQTKKILIR